MENQQNIPPMTPPVSPSIPQQPQRNPQPVPQTPPQGAFQKATEASHKTFSVIGLIAVLALLSYGIVAVTPGIIRSIGSAAVTLSSLFIPASKLSVTADNYTVSSGQPVTLSWSWPAGDTTDEGSYTVSYPCIDGLHLEATDALNPATNDIVFCNTEYHFLNNNNSVTLIPYISSDVAMQSVNVPITLYFTKNGDTNASTNVVTSIVVTNSGISGAPSGVPTVTSTVPVTGTVSTVSSGQPTQPTYVAPTYVAPTHVAPTAGVPQTTTYTQPTAGSGIVPTSLTADLTANILATGVVSTSTNAFTAESPIPLGQRGAIQFEVENIGGKASGPWSFAVVLPTFPAYTFQSTTQQSLAPGDKIEYTIGFDGIKQSPEDSFVINVDNTDEVNEQNKTNNIVDGVVYVNLNN